MNEQKTTSKNPDASSPVTADHDQALNKDSLIPQLNELPEWMLILTGSLLCLLYCAVTLKFSLSLQIYYLFVVAGVGTALQRKHNLPLDDYEKTGFAIIFVFCLISIFTFWVNGMPGKGDIYVEGRHGKFLLAIPVYYFFRQYYIPNRIIWTVAIVVAAELFIVAIIDQSTSTVFGWPGRASGNTHPIYFAIISLMMAVLILVFHEEWGKQATSRWIARSAILAAILALIMTGSRSVWLCLPAIALVYLISRNENFGLRQALKAAAIVAVASALLYQLPPVKDRWDEAIQEFKAYQISESADDPVRKSSLGARLEMWRAARLMIFDNPLLGVGTGGFQVTANNYFENGGWSVDITTRNGPHNQYLNSWASRGIGGLITTLLVLAAPFFYCVHIRRESSDQGVRRLALASMMIITIFAIAGLSDDSLEKKPLIILYLTSLALLLGQIRHRCVPSTKVN